MIKDRDATAVRSVSFLSGLHQSFVFISPNTLLCRGAPFDASRPHFTGYGPLASLALYLRLVRPYLGNLIAPETSYLFRIGRLYLSASGTTFLQGHIYILHLKE